MTLQHTLDKIKPPSGQSVVMATSLNYATFAFLNIAVQKLYNIYVHILKCVAFDII